MSIYTIPSDPRYPIKEISSIFDVRNTAQREAIAKALGLNTTPRIKQEEKCNGNCGSCPMKHMHHSK